MVYRLLGWDGGRADDKYTTQTMYSSPYGIYTAGIGGRGQADDKYATQTTRRVSRCDWIPGNLTQAVDILNNNSGVDFGILGVHLTIDTSEKNLQKVN